MSEAEKRFCPLNGGHCPTRAGGNVFSYDTIANLVGNAGIVTEGGGLVKQSEREEARKEELLCRFWSVKLNECKIIVTLRTLVVRMSGLSVE